ncbi:MAG: TonB-dependent receptor [Bacteroidetes bacterium]|nr:TonB-dependent receptor [Bacteroidota bacterium]
MKRFFSVAIAFFIVLICGTPVYAQYNDSTTHTLRQAVVTSYKEKPAEQTSLQITPIDIDSLSNYGNYNLTDLLAKTPGVTMLSTGPSIMKPVIRGLYGNRVLVLISGLKFDNQQWQDEHGMGLSDIGLSKTEVIKGPMSVLYGTEAVGGVINILEEEKPAKNTKVWEKGIQFNSNTLGGLTQIGYKASNDNRWFRIRVGVENNGDYSDGKNNRVLNSRFDGYYLKASYGFHRKNWTSVNHLMSSYNRFGFIFNDVYTFVKPDARWSRDLADNPAHFVILNMASSENKIYLKNGSKLNINFGVQSNERMENEGSGKISLDMHLITIQHLIKWEKKLSDKNKLILSHLHSFEINTNYGSRKIVPNARMQESNQSAYLETQLKKGLVWEVGVGFGEKYIKTLLTATVNTEEKVINPFTKFSMFGNFFSGITWFANPKTNIKFNIASGVRVPNLAELSSNGLHEGVFTYEIGDPNMKNEQNIEFNFLFTRRTTRYYFTATPFFNRFYNYVYLAPTTRDWYGFPVYVYEQKHVSQYGGEAEAGYSLNKNSVLSVTYSGMISKSDDGTYTPFIPAQRFKPMITKRFVMKNGSLLNFYINADIVLQQNLLARLETRTPGYQLLNAGINTVINKDGRIWKLSIAGNNLTNTYYYDHLSRFKNYGIYNQGRNIVFNVKTSITKSRS